MLAAMRVKKHDVTDALKRRVTNLWSELGKISEL